MLSTQTLTTLKILLIGDANVGKSSILLRFTDGTFDSEKPHTVGVDFKLKRVQRDEKIVKLAIWDTAGQERFRTLSPAYYRGAQGVILTYDVTNSESFKNLDVWMDEVNKYSTCKNIVKMVIGNKVDMMVDRVVSHDEGVNFSRRNRALFLETSARTSFGINLAFNELTDKILSTSYLWTPHEDLKIEKTIDNEGSKFFCNNC